MQKILIAIAATLFVAGAAHAAETCEAQATAKNWPVPPRPPS
jgi:hypothetical protein